MVHTIEYYAISITSPILGLINIFEGYTICSLKLEASSNLTSVNERTDDEPREIKQNRQNTDFDILTNSTNASIFGCFPSADEIMMWPTKSTNVITAVSTVPNNRDTKHYCDKHSASSAFSNNDCHP